MLTMLTKERSVGNDETDYVVWIVKRLCSVTYCNFPSDSMSFQTLNIDVLLLQPVVR